MPCTRTLACALPAAAALVVLAAAPAAAHVGISPTDGEAGAHTVLTASVPHGCDGSPTTRLAIQVPEQIMSVTPTRNPLWEVRKVMEQLDEPVADTHGNEITERVAQVVYTAKEPLPEGYRDALELSLQLPDSPGETLAFPTIQTCEQGETAWVETSADGSTDELEAPAPTVTVLPAADQGATDASAELTTTSAETNAAEEQGGASNALGIAALVAAVLALGVAAAALVSSRRRP